MILNGPIFTSLFLAGLGMLLGLAAASAWVGSLRTGEGRYEHLAYLLLLTAFGLRLLSWPLFYVSLGSAVPYVEGAMCIFGVTRLQPLWANLLQLLRPLSIFALGGWLTLRLARTRQERRAPGPALPAGSGETGLLISAILLLVADGLLELFLYFGLRPGLAVHCCGSVYDLPDRFSSRIPGQLLGPQHAELLQPALMALGLLVALGCLWLGFAARRGRRVSRLARAALWLLLPALLLLAAVSAMEVIAPRLLGLPFHHCLYCLLGRSVAGPWMAATLGGGLLAAGWGSLLPGGPSGRQGGRLLISGGLLLLLFLLISGIALQSGVGRRLGPCPACGTTMHDTVHLVELVCGADPLRLFCSPRCAMEVMGERGPGTAACRVTVRDEFTGTRLDSGAAVFVEAGREIIGLPPGNRWHAYQYLDNAHIMAFQLEGNIVEDPFYPLPQP